MIRIFVSYRREDAADVTGRLNDRLREAFGGDAVFTDVDGIPIGVDFREHLAHEVGKCDVLLAVIGRSWVDITDDDGRRRLDQSQDFVRTEIESALARGIPVVPLLAHGTSMPDEDDLPDSIKELAYRNGTTLRPDPDFHKDVDRLIAGLERIVSDRRPGDEAMPGASSTGDEQGAGAASRRPKRSAARYVAGFVAVALVAFGAWFYVEQRAADAEREVARKAKIERQAKLAAAREAEAERQRLAELEAKRQAEERDRRAKLEAEREAEAERRRLAELEAKRQAELEAKRQAELEAKRQAEVERLRKAKASCTAGPAPAGLAASMGPNGLFIGSHCYYLANGRESCTSACRRLRRGGACDVEGLRFAATSLDRCKAVVARLGGRGGLDHARAGQYPDNDAGCTFYDSRRPEERWVQLMRRSASGPTCDAVDRDPSRLRVCACS